MTSSHPFFCHICEGKGEHGVLQKEVSGTGFIRGGKKKREKKRPNAIWWRVLGLSLPHLTGVAFPLGVRFVLVVSSSV